MADPRTLVRVSCLFFRLLPHFLLLLLVGCAAAAAAAAAVSCVVVVLHQRVAVLCGCMVGCVVAGGVVVARECLCRCCARGYGSKGQ